MRNSFPIVLALAAALAAPAQEAGANLPAQRIGPNDLLAVSVYGSPELTRSVRVGADGVIRLPMLKQRIKAAGLMPSDLEIRIAGALGEEQILVDPVVTVAVAEYHSRPISVAGAVRSPVTFQAAGHVTLLDALTRAGGLSPEAGPEVLVSRLQPGQDGTPTALVQRVQVKSLIDAADPEANLRLAGGEEIRVPEAGRVYVVGTVRRPGAYAVQNAAETTVLQVLALAEGLAPYASRQAFIYRQGGPAGSKHEIAIELGKILARKAPDVPLQPNDIFYVPDNTGRRITVGALEKIAGFGSATASGLLIWRR